MIPLPFLSEHSGERGQFLKLFGQLLGPAFFLLVAGEFMAQRAGWIGSGAFWFLVLIVNLPLIFFFSVLLYAVIDRTVDSAAALASGNLPSAPAHSGCESLEARGLYHQAADAYRALIAAHPSDNLARIKLAELYRAHLGEPESAERLFVEVRQNHPDPRHDFLAANLLLELHRSTGRRDRLMVEMAKFADRYRNTRAGRDAARALKEMKEEMRRGEDC